MALSHEHIEPKISAKIKTYTLRRAKLICSLCHEIPCGCLISGTCPQSSHALSGVARSGGMGVIVTLTGVAMEAVEAKEGVEGVKDVEGVEAVEGVGAVEGVEAVEAVEAAAVERADIGEDLVPM